MYEIIVLNPESLLVSVFGTEHLFRGRGYLKGYFIGSYHRNDDSCIAAGQIVQGLRMGMRFSDATFVSDTVCGATVYGQGWHYEVISGAAKA